MKTIGDYACNCLSTGAAAENEEKPGPASSQPTRDSAENDQRFEVEAIEPIGLLAGEGSQAQGGASGRAANALEALLGPGGFPPVLDIPPDADDETMVELAIALSLQANLQPGLQSLQALVAEGLVQEPGSAQVSVRRKLDNIIYLCFVTRANSLACVLRLQ